MSTRNWLQRRWTAIAVALALLVPLFGISTPVAHAVTITVNSTAGTKVTDGACTLREAIENANNDATTWPDCAAGSGVDIIVLPAGATIIALKAVDNGAGTLNANGLPVITSNITINGNGAIIQRNLLGTPAFRIFQVASGGTLTLNNVTVRGGLTPDGSAGSDGGYGGGICNLGTLTITNSTVSGNQTGDGDGSGHGGYGGGICNLGTLTITNSTIGGNRTGEGDWGGEGGGISNYGTLNVDNSIISGNTTGNGSGTGSRALSKSGLRGLATLAGPYIGSGGYGGGISNYGTLNVDNSTIGGNTTGNGATYGGYGGGISNCGTLSITNSTISDNVAGDGSSNDGGHGGGIYSDGTLTITNSTISDNVAGNGAHIYNGGDGGGIYHCGMMMNITNSIIRGNRTGDGGWAGAGGGIYNTGASNVVNSTINNNTTGNGLAVYGGGPAGGIFNTGAMAIENSTIAWNRTGTPYGKCGGIGNVGMLSVTSSTIARNIANGGQGGGICGDGVTLRNTIVWNNTAFSDANCSGTITNGGNNLENGMSCGWGSDKGSMSNTDPLLDNLADNGGSTQTMALLPGSPAIDGVTWNAPNGSPFTDQRGVARPQGARHDIGAYEWVGWKILLPLVLRNTP